MKVYQVYYSYRATHWSGVTSGEQFVKAEGMQQAIDILRGVIHRSITLPLCEEHFYAITPPIDGIVATVLHCFYRDGNLADPV